MAPRTCTDDDDPSLMRQAEEDDHPHQSLEHLSSITITTGGGGGGDLGDLGNLILMLIVMASGCDSFTSLASWLAHLYIFLPHCQLINSHSLLLLLLIR